MLSGKVKWFNNAKGYGFIIEDGKNEDLFAHYSAIQMDGYKTLKAGQAVSFRIIQGPKGLHAVDIQALVTAATPATKPQHSGEQAPAAKPQNAEAHAPAETARA